MSFREGQPHHRPTRHRGRAQGVEPVVLAHLGDARHTRSHLSPPSFATLCGLSPVFSTQPLLASRALCHPLMPPLTATDAGDPMHLRAAWHPLLVVLMAHLLPRERWEVLLRG